MLYEMNTIIIHIYQQFLKHNLSDLDIDCECGTCSFYSKYKHK